MIIVAMVIDATQKVMAIMKIDKYRGHVCPFLWMLRLIAGSCTHPEALGI